LVSHGSNRTLHVQPLCCRQERAGEQWCAKRGFARVGDLTGAAIDERPMETFAAAAMPIG
jgi:hypothetical protein